MSEVCLSELFLCPLGHERAVLMIELFRARTERAEVHVFQAWTRLLIIIKRGNVHQLGLYSRLTMRSSVKYRLTGVLKSATSGLFTHQTVRFHWRIRPDE